VSTNGTRRPRTAKSIAGSGNVFGDIGFANADEMLARSELVRHINRIIQQRGLNQVDAAKLLGINQPKVSALKCGRITEFSMDRLMRFLVALGQGVDISIRPASRPGLRVARLRHGGKLPEVA
jgi:predicted XRE-type DNA-binding protein